MISKILNNLKLFFEVFLSATIASIIGLLATEKTYFYVYRVALLISTLLTVVVTVALYYKDDIDAYLWSQDIRGYLEFPRIGILFDEKIDKHFSKIEIEQWTSYFNEEKFIVENITKEEIHIKYSVILNPYGETYPEEDLFHLKTLTEIRRYINQGGIFVNVAGIPFYYGYDALNDKNVPLANEIYT